MTTAANCNSFTDFESHNSLGEAVRRADEGIAIQAQQVALQDFDALDVMEAAPERSCDLRVTVAQAHPHEAVREVATERLDDLHPHPPDPLNHQPEHGWAP